MSGYMDTFGAQWERCSNCGLYVEIGKLLYERPSIIYPHGRDLCRKCGKGKDVVPPRPVIMLHLAGPEQTLEGYLAWLESQTP